MHVKENILYYMQAIWSHEPPDQRFFRLYNIDVPDRGAGHRRRQRQPFCDADGRTMPPGLSACSARTMRS